MQLRAVQLYNKRVLEIIAALAEVERKALGPPPHRAATYRGLQALLPGHKWPAVRQAVLEARQEGVVEHVPGREGGGGHRAAEFRLTDKGREAAGLPAAPPEEGRGGPPAAAPGGARPAG